MGESLFQRKPDAASAPTSLTPHQMIEKEVEHLKKGKLARYGDKPVRKASIWLIVVTLCALVWLYIMDPVMHAWYKYEAAHAYRYLHNYGAGKEFAELAASGILSPEEIHQLDRSTQTDKDYYSTPRAGAQAAQTIVDYMASVKALHKGVYVNLDPVGRVRYTLFVRYGIIPPTSWNFLDPGIGNN